jgi:O-acetyl-ADP-ribose deacetylase (regulator of RNase III)|tara:strand:- start:405 stop:665 length:261 start_codon:yes stop_codon:yes gene_type:complete
MARTIDQQIAEAQAKLARLKTRAKASETRRKIIVGSIVSTEALKDPKIARWLASTLRKKATREVDQKELTDLLAELDETAEKANQS